MSSFTSRLFSVSRILSSRHTESIESDRLQRRMDALQENGGRNPRLPSLFRS